MKKNFFVIVLLLIVISQVPFKASGSKIISVEGTNVFENTLLLCRTIGLDTTIKPGMRIGILVNSDFEVRGAYVSPDVTLAVVKTCIDAGAAEVVSLQNIKPEYWQRSAHFEKLSRYVKKVRSIEQNTFPSVFDSVNFVRIDSFPGAPNLKNLEVVREVFEVDYFINIPVAKHHASTILTNAMKNMMGLNTRAFNVTFHLNGPKRNDPEFLATCIAEMNLVRKPDLIVADVTEVITTNGPVGPGEMVKPMRVVAGTDPVAVDAFCATLLGFNPERVLTVQKGFELGLGEKSLDKVLLYEIQGK
ncbi:MAG TPA: DUF362 domain-containing protein [Tenuifilaceae bacterium]|nr:DUF362 domain-containing protein [Tenuifilaceae bacterium]HRX68963.1 DUF362 domain-containing protein [Tenuifilaceae bacterium]